MTHTTPFRIIALYNGGIKSQNTKYNLQVTKYKIQYAKFWQFHELKSSAICCALMQWCSDTRLYVHTSPVKLERKKRRRRAKKRKEKKRRSGACFNLNKWMMLMTIMIIMMMSGITKTQQYDKKEKEKNWLIQQIFNSSHTKY